MSTLKQRCFTTYLVSSLLYTGLVCAQQSVNVTGGAADGSGGSLAYSVGQVVYQTYSSGSSSISQGVQQPYEVSTLSTTVPVTEFNMKLKAFPNPTTHTITLEVGDTYDQNLSYQLFDLLGRLLKSGKITQKHTQVNMSDFGPSTYLIRLQTEEQKTLQTFKIIKK